MPDVTPARRARIAQLFELHHDRLIRALRARLGRYDWHFADDIAAATWMLAVQKIDLLTASNADAFEWLSALARIETIAHYRRVRDLATGSARIRGYCLPASSAVRDVAMARLRLRRVLVGPSAPLGVAA